MRKLEKLKTLVPENAPDLLTDVAACFENGGRTVETAVFHCPLCRSKPLHVQWTQRSLSFQNVCQHFLKKHPKASLQLGRQLIRIQYEL